MAKISLLVIVVAFIACAVAGPVPSTRFFQGDIKLTEAQFKLLNGITPRTGLIDTFYRWPRNLQGQAVMPYIFDPNAGFTQAELDMMMHEMNVIQSRTCVRFEPRTTQHDYVLITNGDGCWSHFGRIGGQQELSMSRTDDCLVPGIMSHDVMHALGYHHMHSSIERDDYVDVFWDNIDPDFFSVFETVDPEMFSNFGTPYDLRSSTHYPRDRFSINGQDTILPHDRSQSDVIGRTGEISDGDITRILRMYECIM